MSIGVSQPSNDHRRLPGQFVVIVISPQREDQPDPVCQLATCHERECLGRDGIQPLRVIDHAHQRLLLRHVGQQAQHRQSDQEPVRRLPGAHPENRGQRITLRDRQSIEVVQHRRAQLMQAGEGQFQFGVDTGRSCESAARPEPVRQVVQQGCLADAGLAAQYQHLTHAGAQAVHDSVKSRALALPASELGRQPAWRHDDGRELKEPRPAVPIEPPGEVDVCPSGHDD